MTSPTCQTCAYLFTAATLKGTDDTYCTRGEPPWRPVAATHSCRSYAAHVCHQCALWSEWTGDCLKVGHNFATMDADTPACKDFEERED